MPPKAFPWRLVLAAALLCLLGAFGWYSGDQAASGTEFQMRKILVTQAKEIANGITPAAVAKLAFTASDEGTPAFELIRKHLVAKASKFPTVKRVYTFALSRGDTLVYGPSSLTLGDKDYLAPGSTFTNPPEELLMAMRYNAPDSVGPYDDLNKPFKSAFASVFDSDLGRIVLVVGVDVPAGEWQAQIDQARRGPLLVTLATLLILLGTGTILFRFLKISDADIISLTHVATAMQQLGVDDIGLDQQEQRYLRILSNAGGCLRLNVLAMRLGVPVRTITRMVEPFLVRQGLVCTSDRGRELTPKGADYLKGAAQ